MGYDVSWIYTTLDLPNYMPLGLVYTHNDGTVQVSDGRMEYPAPQEGDIYKIGDKEYMYLDGKWQDAGITVEEEKVEVKTETEKLDEVDNEEFEVEENFDEDEVEDEIVS